MIIPIETQPNNNGVVLNGVSYKVAAPGYVGLVATVIVCTLGKMGISVDPGTIVGIVVAIMSLVGWLVHSIEQQNQNRLNKELPTK